jgi:hypothetical protein
MIASKNYSDRVTKDEMGRVCTKHGYNSNAYKVSLSKTEVKWPAGRHRLRREDNIKINLREIERSGRNWINVAQYRDKCEQSNEPSDSLKGWETLE